MRSPILALCAALLVSGCMRTQPISASSTLHVPAETSSTLENGGAAGREPLCRTDGVHFNVRDFGATGSRVEVRGVIQQGSNVLQVSERGDFKNGQFISIKGAGPMLSGFRRPLRAQILSGGGTRTLNLSKAASNDTPALSYCSNPVTGVPYACSAHRYDPGLVVHDDAPHVQLAVNCASKLFDQTSYPATGVYNPPIVFFPPGSYRFDTTVIVPPGPVLQGPSADANTLEGTRIIMDKENQDGTPYRTPMFVFTRYTGARLDQSVDETEGKLDLSNAVFRVSRLTGRVENLAVWWVTPNDGGSFDNPHGGIGILGDANGFPLFRAAAFMALEGWEDFRFTHVNCSHGPACIWMSADGPGPIGENPRSRRFLVYIEDSEFDAGLTGIYAENADLDLSVSNVEFFSGGMPVFNGVTGHVRFDDSQLTGGYAGGAAVRVVNSSLSTFSWVGGSADITNGDLATFDIDKAANVLITGLQTRGAGAGTLIRVRNAVGSVIANNSIVNAGMNAPAHDPAIWPTHPSWRAAIKLEGCKNVVVSANDITHRYIGNPFELYNEFGILTIDSLSRWNDPGAVSANNLVSDNLVTGYNGEGYRGQPRRINLAPGEIGRDNVELAQ